MSTLPSSRRPAMFDGRLDGKPSGEGAIYAWLDREPLGVELYATLRQCDGDLDRASERWADRHGGHPRSIAR